MSLTRQYRVDDRMNNEYGAVCGIIIGAGETEVLRENHSK
jgi:hypothetical protein